MKIAVYPGSFDPITNGHIDILKRALRVFDKVIVLVSVNPEKKSLFTPSEKVAMIKGSVKGLGNVEVDSCDGITVEYASKHGACALIRGLRAVSDFEYEFQLAAVNRFIDKDIEEVFMMADHDTSFISSSMIRDLHAHGVDVKDLVPLPVYEAFKLK